MFDFSKWSSQWWVPYLTLLAIGGCLAGCSTRGQTAEDYREKMQVGADFAEQLGLDFEGVLIFSDGHVMGQSYNIAGIHGFAKISGKPHRATSQPVIP